MPEKKAPFVTRTVTCPVCKKMYRQRMFRSHVFVPGEQESDQHVLNYRWKTADIERVHPPYYALYYCPFCFYTDLTDDFCHAAENNASNWICRTFWKQPDESQHVIELLGRHIDYETITFCSALNLHYLAVFLQFIPQEDIRDEYKLGRLLLRLAWLYREAESGMEIPGGPAECHGNAFFGYPDYCAFQQDLKKYWADAPANEMEAMRAAAAHFEKAISADPRFDDPQKYAVAVKLVLNLLRRLGAFEEAYRLVRGMYSTGMDQRREIQEKINAGLHSESAKRQAQKYMNAVNQYLGEAAEERDQLLDEMADRDTPRIKEIIARNPGVTPETFQEVLTQNGILPEVVRRMKQKKAAASAGKSAG
jgi:tetratricopeptide (TPR) repeat protein